MFSGHTACKGKIDSENTGQIGSGEDSNSNNYSLTWYELPQTYAALQLETRILKGVVYRIQLNPCRSFLSHSNDARLSLFLVDHIEMCFAQILQKHLFGL